jgi:uncharacterized protein YceH (UPF0502 family)
MEQSEGRIGILEMRVDRLETWAGPGEAEATAAGLLAVRTELAAVRSTQDKHSGMLRSLTRDVSVLKSDVAQLKSDVAQLKSDVADLKIAVHEILRRLPPAS